MPFDCRPSRLKDGWQEIIGNQLLVTVNAVNNNVKFVLTHGVFVAPKSCTGINTFIVDIITVNGSVVNDKFIRFVVIVADFDSGFKVGKTAVIVKYAVVYGKFGVYSSIKKDCFTIGVEGAVVESCVRCAPSPDVINIAGYVESAVVKYAVAIKGIGSVDGAVVISAVATSITDIGRAIGGNSNIFKSYSRTIKTVVAVLAVGSNFCYCNAGIFAITNDGKGFVLCGSGNYVVAGAENDSACSACDCVGKLSIIAYFYNA